MQSFPCHFCGSRPEPEFLFVTKMGKTRPEPVAEVSTPVWAAYLNDVKNI
jgi:sarcosine oxidase delta subunit